MVNAVFLDRDGTLNDDPGYLGDPDKVKLFPNTGESLFILQNKLNFKLIVISNQSGIARGLLKEDDVKAVNQRINELLKDYKVKIDAFYYCPFHPEFSSKEECLCRKPSPKMVLQAAEDLKINLTQSYLIGDAVSDVECGINAGIKTILVKTGYGNESFSTLQKLNKIPTFVANNISEAVSFIQNDISGETE